ncbi:MAG: hypothetical protein AMK70_13605 [Nitrospira bacterium SG8_35_1]|nr:MAG: hypothetical protein AMK70_13605 [Nitrospira bacterium SG8_35_1]
MTSILCFKNIIISPMKKEMLQSIDNIYRINLAIRKNERILVLTDKKETKIKKFLIQRDTMEQSRRKKHGRLPMVKKQ